MAKEILENAGINVVVLNQHDTAIKSFGEYGIYVTNEKVTEAVKLLKELKGE